MEPLHIRRQLDYFNNMDRHRPTLPNEFVVLDNRNPFSWCSIVNKDPIDMDGHGLDISTFHPSFRRNITEGTIRYTTQNEPLYGEEIVQQRNGRTRIFFCHTPFLMTFTGRNFSLPIMLILHPDGNSILPNIDQEERIQIFDIPRRTRDKFCLFHRDLTRMMNRVVRYDDIGNYYYEPNPNDYIPNIRPFGGDIPDDDDRPAAGGGRRRRQAIPDDAPAGGAAAGARAQVPTHPLPAERVALALARDGIAHGALCPITQSPLEYGGIAVTSCFCVFEANSLGIWFAQGNNTCPACRTATGYRTVIVDRPAPAAPVPAQPQPPAVALVGTASEQKIAAH